MEQIKIKINKIISILLIFLMVMVTGVNAITQIELLRYQFEEGSGSIVLDTSGNNFHATNVGANYDTTQATFGTYGMDFDGNLDYLTTISGSNIPELLSVSLWVDMDGNPQTTLLNMFGNNDDFKILLDSDGASNIELIYNDIGAIPRTQTLSNNPFLINTMYHLVLNFDFINQTFNVYRNGILDGNGNLNYQVSREDGANTLKIGANRLNGNEFDGDIDEFRIFFGNLNQIQVNTLYNTNTVTLITPPTTEEPIEIIGSTPLNIINSTSPIESETVNNYMTYNVILNYKSTCDLYLNNNLEKTFVDVFAFTHETIYSVEGLQSYFVYCEFVDGNHSYFDVTSIINFEISLGVNNVNFVLYDEQDNLFYGENLYLVTPCLKEYAGIFQTTLNQQTDKYIQKIINGQASFNLEYTDKYEFCLIRGQINYQDDDYSKNFDLVEVNKQLELGDLFVKNDTLSYSFRIANTDILNMYEPSFWDKTWGELFNLIISIIIGGVIIGLGILMKSDKVVMGGIIILIAGMGVSSLSLIGGILL